MGKGKCKIRESIQEISFITYHVNSRIGPEPITKDTHLVLFDLVLECCNLEHSEAKRLHIEPRRRGHDYSFYRFLLGTRFTWWIRSVVGHDRKGVPGMRKFLRNRKQSRLASRTSEQRANHRDSITLPKRNCDSSRSTK